MCNYSLCFEVYVTITFFVAWYEFSIFGCMHNLKQTYESVLKTVEACATWLRSHTFSVGLNPETSVVLT